MRLIKVIFWNVLYIAIKIFAYQRMKMLKLKYTFFYIRCTEYAKYVIIKVMCNIYARVKKILRMFAY